MNMDTSHFYAACSKVLKGQFVYMATVSDFMNIENGDGAWENKLSEIVAIDDGATSVNARVENVVESGQNRLILGIIKCFINGFGLYGY